MSRYIKEFGNLEYHYGYDYPLKEYFFSKFDSNQAEDEEMIFGVSNNFPLLSHDGRMGGYSTMEIVHLIHEEEKELNETIVDPEHLSNMMSDLPF